MKTYFFDASREAAPVETGVPTASESNLLPPGWNAEHLLGAIPPSATPPRRAGARRSVPHHEFMVFMRVLETVEVSAEPEARSAGFQTCCIADFQVGGASAVAQPAGLETRDTADLEVCATTVRFIVGEQVRMEQAASAEPPNGSAAVSAAARYAGSSSVELIPTPQGSSVVAAPENGSEQSRWVSTLQGVTPSEHAKAWTPNACGPDGSGGKTVFQTRSVTGTVQFMIGRRRVRPVWFAAFGIALAFVATLAAAPPVPTPRTHTEVATKSDQRFTIHMGGTMDGANTRTPIGYASWSRTFEPMREVRIENIGTTPVSNPWLTVNGRHDWRTAQKIVEEATRDCQNDRERAIAIWRFVIEHRFHATPNDGDNIDPVKQFNVYGYSLCGDIAQTIRQLWKIGSFQTRRGWPHGHCLTEVWFDDAWHMLDGDEQIICLGRDNETIVGETEIVRDHDLMKRTHTYGILAGESPLTDQFSAALHVYEGERKGDYADNFGHRMDLTLRPGESLAWRWDNVGRSHGTNLKTGWGPQADEPLANGRLVYAPPQASAAGERAGEALVVPMASPYVIVGGKLEFSGTAKAFISFDQKNWQAVSGGSLDALFPPEGKPRYRYWLKFDPASALQSFRVENVLQMAPLSLPTLAVGNNEVRYQDDTDGPRKVRITFDWQERSDSQPPAAPVAEFPQPGARVEGTQFTFAWSKTGADYHFQLSDRADLRWPLSPTFDRLISLTPQRGTASWAIPWRGLLNPGRTYYWRVRARNADGLWGNWSQAFTFTPEGPGVALKVRYDPATQAIRWESNPKGRPPVKWRVYASDEKGFTASDTPQRVIWESPQDGRPREVQEWPANFVGESTKSEWRVLTNAFYRVVAVDAKGVASGPSDYAAVPRPRILTSPITQAKAGQAYRYSPRVIRSLGDLRCKKYSPEKIYWAGYWNVEKPKWSLHGAPEWLRLDADTGELAGTPPAHASSAQFPVELRCEIAGVGTDTQTFTLRLEK